MRLKIPSAVLVGHDWGATHAWNAAMMRPDRFTAVFCLSVPYVPRGEVSVFERMRKSGHQDDFYMFEQIRPDADQIWADAADDHSGDTVLGVRFCPRRETMEPVGSGP